MNDSSGSKFEFYVPYTKADFISRLRAIIEEVPDLPILVGKLNQNIAWAELHDDDAMITWEYDDGGIAIPIHTGSATFPFIPPSDQDTSVSSAE